MIDITNLRVRYGETIAVDLREAIHIERGERIGIIGSNGAGKTSLVNALLGLIPAEGRFHVGVPRSEIGVHMQINSYAETMPVRVIIETVLGAPLRRLPLVQELIDFFNFEGSLGKSYRKLSGGQKQRLTLIMVLAMEQPLVFFDEVTSGLDYETRQRLIDKLISWYDARETTLVMISHYYEELENLVDRILYLEEGQLVAFGRKHELFRRYCGRTIITLANSPEHLPLIAGFERLVSPEHLLAVSCGDTEAEARLTARLREHNIDYRRSSSDIEIMSINALATWRRQNVKESA
ncbi:MAG: ABC transporter ATP-binding protein [Bacillota bacterium]|nr:ABC transporter ATP-binding protein [Bacillota bacterium]